MPNDKLCEAIDVDKDAGFAKIFPAFALISYRLQIKGKLKPGNSSEAWVHAAVADPVTAIENRYWADGETSAKVRLESR